MPAATATISAAAFYQHTKPTTNSSSSYHHIKLTTLAATASYHDSKSSISSTSNHHPSPSSLQADPCHHHQQQHLGRPLDQLGRVDGFIHSEFGHSVKETCCPLLEGLPRLFAALCLCISIRIKLPNIEIFLSLAIDVLITCGKSPPPGFYCSMTST